MKQKSINKTQLLPSFLTVDQCKKAEQFWDPKQTLYSCHGCNELRTNVKHHYSSFELSNVVNGRKFEKLLTLNEAQNNLWAKYVFTAGSICHLKIFLIVVQFEWHYLETQVTLHIHKKKSQPQNQSCQEEQPQEEH
jgi:hypothetical protein